MSVKLLIKMPSASTNMNDMMLTWWSLCNDVWVLPSAGVPPPMPAADLSGLSEEELRVMEGEERESLESRVQCLRNIHTLLDAAMLQIQQYTAVVSRSVDSILMKVTCTSAVISRSLTYINSCLKVTDI